MCKSSTVLTPINPHGRLKQILCYMQSTISLLLNVRSLLFSTEGSAFHIGTVFLQGNKEVFVTTDGSCTAFQRRPFLKDFLEAVCPLFEVAVFTAGSRVRPPPRTPPHLPLSTECESWRNQACSRQLASCSVRALLMMEKHTQSDSDCFHERSSRSPSSPRAAGCAPPPRMPPHPAPKLVSCMLQCGQAVVAGSRPPAARKPSWLRTESMHRA